MNDKPDHDLLIEISADIKYVRKELSRCNERYDQLRKDIDYHDRWVNRAKGAIYAIIALLGIFGATLLYLLFK